MKTSTPPSRIMRNALIAALCLSPVLASASEAELMKRLDQLAAELQSVKAELAATKQKTEAVEQRQQSAAATAQAAPAVAATANTAAPAPSAESTGPQTVLSGYGEVTYTRPTKNASAAEADVRRVVLGLSHRFDDKTKLVTEFEWEHAVTSAGDRGEATVEQAYIERELSNGMRAKAGLFLIPAGLLNTNHEPTAFYGVDRNFVETAIIPTTWREAGVGLSSTLDNGLTWDIGITTGFDLSKWDAASGDGRDSPLGSIHQEGQLAKSRDLSAHGALNWRGIPGLLLGGSVFSGKAGHATADFAGNDARVSLWDLHARYTPGPWDLSALYARGTISNAGTLNLISVGNPNPIPSSFSGWYTQAAYRAWQAGDYTLSPFVRYERFNTAQAFAGLPAGAEAATGPTEKVVTVGANLRVGEGVVLKADYQKFSEDTSRDRLNLGLGYAF
jgi:hypothetical protein